MAIHSLRMLWQVRAQTNDRRVVRHLLQTSSTIVGQHLQGQPATAHSVEVDTVVGKLRFDLGKQSFVEDKRGKYSEAGTMERNSGQDKKEQHSALDKGLKEARRCSFAVVEEPEHIVAVGPTAATVEGLRLVSERTGQLGD